MGDLEGGLAAVRGEGDQALARRSEAAKDGDHVFGCFATISDSLARRRVSSTPSLWRKRAICGCEHFLCTCGFTRIELTLGPSRELDLIAARQIPTTDHSHT